METERTAMVNKSKTAKEVFKIYGAYYAFAEKYRKYFLEENIDLQIVETSGSVENLKLLADNNLSTNERR